MASFCTACGAPVAGKFCTKCGAAAQSAPPPQPSYPTPQPAAPAAAASSGSALKIVLIVVGVLFVMGAIGVASMVYVGIKAKQKITELARDNGISVGSDSGVSVKLSPVTSTPKGDRCSVLSGEDAQQILGIAVERVETTSENGPGTTCKYWISLAERRRLASAQIAAGISGVSKSKGDDPDLGDAARIVGGALTALTTTDKSGADDFAFSIEVNRSGGKQAFQSLMKTQETLNTAGGFGMKELEGVGDKAFMIAAGQAIAVLKNDTYMYLGFAQMAPGPEKATALAKKAAERL